MALITQDDWLAEAQSKYLAACGMYEDEGAPEVASVLLRFAYAAATIANTMCVVRNQI